jgi:hypothetical protein
MLAGKAGRVALKDQIGVAFAAVFTAIFINGHVLRSPSLKILRGIYRKTDALKRGRWWVKAF